VTEVRLDDWLGRLGYAEEKAVLHRRGKDVAETHPYALEIKALLRPEGAIRAQAVFDVEGVPTVIFIGDDNTPSRRALSMTSGRKSGTRTSQPSSSS
jgi:hypothetical protein